MRKLALLLLFAVFVCAQEEEGAPGEEEAEDGGLGALGGVLSRKPERIDFTKVDRTIRKLPELKSTKPLYGLFLFGVDGRTRVWAVLDASADTLGGSHILYLDRNADGDLTGKDERFRSKDGKFEIGDFTEPGTEVVHKAFRMTRHKAFVRYEMKWAGGAVIRGPYGPTGEQYANFGASPKEAPIFVLGTERPFEFEHKMSGTLKRGEANDFKVFMGNKGDRTGAFSSVDDKFLPQGERVLVQLVCKDVAGKEQRLTAELAERC